MRVPRSYVENGLYYVISRGDNNREIFKAAADYDFYKQLLEKYKTKYGFELVACSLLPIYIHLVFELKEGLTISEIMHDLSANYTKYFNGKYQYKGHLFQERYKISLLEKERYLTYIQALVNAAQHGFPIESFGNDNKWCHSRESGNPGQESCHSRESGNPITEEELEVFKNELAKNAVLGSQEFLKKVEAALALADAQRARHFPNRKIILAGSLAVLFLGMITFYAYRMVLNRRYHQMLDSYYKGVSKTIQLEQQKVKFLEKRLGTEAAQ